jgi:hypothetical protein
MLSTSLAAAKPLRSLSSVCQLPFVQKKERLPEKAALCDPSSFAVSGFCHTVRALCGEKRSPEKKEKAQPR